MIRVIYNVLIALLAPFWIPWMISRTRKRQNPPNWEERLGNYSIPAKEDRPRVWVHAVSVGEVVAARPILTALKKLSPTIEVILTTTTSTGHEVARSLLGNTVDNLFYFPIDLSFACKRAIASVKPDVVAIMETELWLNFLHFAKRYGARTLIVNGRVSERSFGNSKKIKFYYKAVLSNIDRCLMQTEQDRDRILLLGAQSAEVIGNSKYDEAGTTPTKSLREELSVNPNESVIVVGSARGDFEEDFILDALKNIDARIIFAPRHVERAAVIVDKAKKRGFLPGLRSKAENEAKLLILDTYGELPSAYNGATLAIVGGGFDKLGGQNIIQPLAVGCPVICGPNMANFQEPFQDAIQAGALLVAETPAELAGCIQKLLNEPELRNSMAHAAKALIQSRMGASLLYANAIAEGVQ
jgi:3-deoxy-D-manno-octulosonic-acid transferase